MTRAPMILKALIVDDEPIARKVLRDELQLQPDVTIIGEADTGVEALEKVASLHPHLVFLDLQMPTMDGFDFIRNLPVAPGVPVIIVVTAYHSEAINEFEAAGVDYLLKPIRGSRLLQCLERARNLFSSRGGAALSLAKLQAMGKGKFHVESE